MQHYDLFVIGGGSAGMKAARTSARMGRKVGVAEAKEPGGECFWAGCVPTKALVRAADVWHTVRNAARFGIQVDVCRADFRDAMAYKNRAMHRVGGDGPADAGLSKLGADYFNERAMLESAHEVRIGKDLVVHADYILIATGTDPAIPPIPGLEEAGYLTNREALTLERLPSRIAIIGGGAIGLEFGQIFRRFGATVTVVEAAPQILPRDDADIAALVTASLRAEGLSVLTSTTVIRAEVTATGKRLIVTCGGSESHIDCDEILVAVGRRPATRGLQLAAAGLPDDGRSLRVDEFMRSAVPHILAAGDVTGGQQFTHVASYSGGLAANNMFGETLRPADYRVVPRCTYTDPEVASVGLTTADAMKLGIPIKTRCAKYSDADRPVLYGQEEGMVKLVLDARDNQILGGHVAGANASSLLGEVAVCMQNRLPVDAIAATMHAYPSFPEVIEAAALSHDECTRNA